MELFKNWRDMSVLFNSWWIKRGNCTDTQLDRRANDKQMIRSFKFKFPGQCCLSVVLCTVHCDQLEVGQLNWQCLYRAWESSINSVGNKNTTRQLLKMWEWDRQSWTPLHENTIFPRDFCGGMQRGLSVLGRQLTCFLPTSLPALCYLSVMIYFLMGQFISLIPYCFHLATLPFFSVCGVSVLFCTLPVYSS